MIANTIKNNTGGSDIIRMVIIERKRDDDLISSVKDGRESEQKFRMLQEQVSRDIELIYLIEEKENFVIREPDIYFGAIGNTIIRDKITLIRSRNIEYTIAIIASVYKSMMKYGNFTIQDSIQYHEGKSKLESSMRGISNTFMHQLQAINGVSPHIAREITKNYKNMSQLIQAFMKSGSEILSGIIIKADNVNKYSSDRKIGSALSIKIYAALFN